MTRPSPASSKPGSRTSGKRKAKPSNTPAAPRTSAISSGTCDNLEPLRRVDAVIQWILQGGREVDILDAIAANYPDSNATELVSAAVEQIRLDGDIDQQLVFGFCFLQTKRLMLKMETLGDNAGALAAVKVLMQLVKNAPPPAHPEAPPA